MTRPETVDDPAEPPRLASGTGVGNHIMPAAESARRRRAAPTEIDQALMAYLEEAAHPHAAAPRSAPRMPQPIRERTLIPTTKLVARTDDRLGVRRRR